MITAATRTRSASTVIPITGSVLAGRACCPPMAAPPLSGPGTAPRCATGGRTLANRGHFRPHGGTVASVSPASLGGKDMVKIAGGWVSAAIAPGPPGGPGLGVPRARLQVHRPGAGRVPLYMGPFPGEAHPGFAGRAAPPGTRQAPLQDRGGPPARCRRVPRRNNWRKGHAWCGSPRRLSPGLDAGRKSSMRPGRVRLSSSSSASASTGEHGPSPGAPKGPSAPKGQAAPGGKGCRMSQG